MHAKLAAVGLVLPRDSAELGPWLGEVHRQQRDLKPTAQMKLKQTVDNVLAYFPATTSLRAITHDQAADWRLWMSNDQKLSEASVKTHSGNIKTIFTEAVRRRIIAENPFQALKSGPTASAPDRYLTPGETDKILDALPDSEWRLIFGLARYAGLRVPSESHLLRWGDIDRKRGRMKVQAPKTERYAGHERRTVPVFPKLMKLLQDRYADAAEGTARLVQRRGGHLRRVVEAAAARAGVALWDKLFLACRSSCEKEWAMQFPQYAVSKGIGHGLTVSGRHYVNDVPDELFDRAAGISAQAAQKEAQHSSADTRSVQKSDLSAQPAAEENLA